MSSCVLKFPPRQTVVIGYDKGEPYITMTNPDDISSALELLEMARARLVEYE